MFYKNPFISGVPDLLILLILEKGDSYAYEIVKKIEESSSGALVLSNNTIYTAAYKLEQSGYIKNYEVQVGKKRTRVYYHLEDEGKKYLEELLKLYRETETGVSRSLENLL